MSPAPPIPPTPAAGRALRVAGFWMSAVGVFFGAAGVFLLSMAVRLYATQQDIRAHAEHATGTVVDFKQRIESRSGKSRQRTTYFAPVFTFTDHAGVARRVTSRVSNGDKPGYRVGESVPVVYHHDRPDEAELDTFFASWGGMLIVGGLGAAFFLVGGIVASIGARRLLWPGRFLGSPRDPAILSGL